MNLRFALLFGLVTSLISWTPQAEARRKDRKWPGPRLVCVYSGAATYVSVVSLACTNFKGKRYRVDLLGIGPGFVAHAGIALVKTKLEDPVGDYAFGHGGAYLGAGYIGGAEMENGYRAENPMVRLNAIGIGLGWDVAIAWMEISEYQ